MPKRKDPFKQTKEDVRALRDLWRKLLRKYSEMLDRDEISASLLAEVTKFLQANACTAKDFASLSEVERMGLDGGGKVSDSMVNKTPGQKSSSKDLEEFLATLARGDSRWQRTPAPAA